MKKIVISVIEFDYHAEVLRDFCQIAANIGYTINIFTTESIWGQVLTEGFQVAPNISVYQKKSSTIKQFIHQHYQLLDNSDIIFFNTLASNYRFFAGLKLKPKIIIRIHNTNTYFNKLSQTYKPKFTPFFIWKDTSHFLRKTIGELDWYYRKKNLDRADYYAFSNEIIMQHAINQLNVPKEKSLIIPMSFAPDSSQVTEKKNDFWTNIVVIGKIDQRNRDYQLLYDSFRLIKKKNNSIRLRLTLLGRPVSAFGKQIIRKFERLQDENFELISFSGFIEQKIFKKSINDADFLIIPVNIKTRYTIYEEKYGFTKISGSINDLLKYQKPAIINQEYPLEDAFKNITGSYKDEHELATTIIDWCMNGTYKKMDVRKALKDFRLENIRNQFSKIVKTILDF